METKHFTWLLTNLIIATFVFLAVACSSSDETLQKKAQNYAVSDLIKSLEDYSQQFHINHSTSSRGDMGWSKFKESIKADHVGYHDGSWVGSVGESRKKWKDLQEKENENRTENETGSELLSRSMATSNIDKGKNIEHTIDSLKIIYQNNDTNVGALHNALILQSLLDDDMEFETTEQLVESISRAANKLGLNLPHFDETEAVSEIDYFFEEIYDNDISVMYTRLTELYPEKKDFFQIQENYLSTINNLYSMNDINTFTEGYISIIDHSNISPNMKRILKSNISIAPASHNVWRTVDNLSK